MFTNRARDEKVPATKFGIKAFQNTKTPLIHPNKLNNEMFFYFYGVMK